VVFGPGDQRANTQPPEDLFSVALQLHVALSEMLEEPAVTRDELKAMLSDAVFTKYDPALHDINDAWPHYARDSFVGRYPDTNVPVLIMNGTLDAQTPIEFADAIAPHYTRPGQSYVTFPRSTHGILFGNSPTTTGSSCGMTVWNQFVTSPRSALDTGCTEQIMKIDFQNAPQVSSFFFGTPDMWDGAPPPTRMPSASDAAVVGEFRRVMREGVPFKLPRR
jgi:hypothetical protein